MNRKEHEERLAASHARSESEERDEPLHEWRLRQFKEIDEEMKSILNEINDTDYSEFDSEPF